MEKTEMTSYMRRHRQNLSKEKEERAALKFVEAVSYGYHKKGRVIPYWILKELNRALSARAERPS